LLELMLQQEKELQTIRQWVRWGRHDSWPLALPETLKVKVPSPGDGIAGLFYRIYS
jgi:hypothetical protein